MLQNKETTAMLVFRDLQTLWELNSSLMQTLSFLPINLRISKKMCKEPLFMLLFVAYFEALLQLSLNLCRFTRYTEIWG